MITIDEVQEILKPIPMSNVICSELEFRPKYLAMFFATIANRPEEFGYVIIGAKKGESTCFINGISREIDINEPIKVAIANLTDKVRIEYGKFQIESKTVLAIKIYKLEQSVFTVYDKLDFSKEEQLINDLVVACIKLQASRIYYSATEDERNDYIRDILETAGYNTKDQTRRGKSATGKAAGELDIYVEEKGFPITLIEALNLSSVDTGYIAKHLNKIYTYDSVGTPFNVCLSYVCVKDFKNFWDNYCVYAISHVYPFNMISYDINADKNFPYSEIRFMTTTHNRSGKITHLYHICVKIPEK
ncbi:MAG: hypothetical protein P4L69_21365 [Desulfosporosinus sp.]|nr:hypothetical protein [Desulfosporosinus sp.]